MKQKVRDATQTETDDIQSIAIQISEFIDGKDMGLIVPAMGCLLGMMALQHGVDLDIMCEVVTESAKRMYANNAGRH
jgi:hypothetical protein